MTMDRRRFIRTTTVGAVAGSALAVAGAGERAVADTVPAPDPYLPALPHQSEAEVMVTYLNTPLPPGVTPPTALRNDYKAAGTPGSTVVNWGAPGHPEDYRVFAECASFQTLVLERAYGTGTAYGWATPEYFRTNYFSPANQGDLSKLYPNAAEYRAAFANAAAIEHITAVTKPVNLKPGDLVAIDYDDPANTYTGHIVMIRKAKGTFADPTPDDKVGHDVVPYLFEIIDCTDAPHGSPDVDPAPALANYDAYPDNRLAVTESGGLATAVTTTKGAGYGHMIFYADPVTKLFAGHRWSVNDANPSTVAQQPVAAARVYLG